MPPIHPFLWFDNNAEEAANFYVSVFPNSKIVNKTLCGDSGPGPKGSVLTIEFDLDRKRFVGMNGGPLFKFTEAISFSIECETQKEIDDYWTKLTAGGGQEVQCGWLKDKYGLSWQVVPKTIGKLLSDPDPQRSKRAMEALLKMKKLDIAALQRAADGK